MKSCELTSIGLSLALHCVRLSPLIPPFSTLLSPARVPLPQRDLSTAPHRCRNFRGYGTRSPNRVRRSPSSVAGSQSQEAPRVIDVNGIDDVLHQVVKANRLAEATFVCRPAFFPLQQPTMSRSEVPRGEAAMGPAATSSSRDHVRKHRSTCISLPLYICFTSRRMPILSKHNLFEQLYCAT